MPTKKTATFAAVLTVLAAASGAQAQVTADQQAAIRSSCRSDFMSNCSSVKPGGVEALQCLQKNAARLSPACRTAVDAATPKPAIAAPAPPPPPVAAPPPPAAVPAPAAAAPAPTIATAKPPPASITPSAPRPAAPKPAAAPMPPAPAKPAAPAAPQQAAVPPSPPPAAPPATETRRPNAPVVMTAVIGRACLRDLVRRCRDTGVGDGQKIACLQANEASLAPLCKAALKGTAPIR